MDMSGHSFRNVVTQFPSLSSGFSIIEVLITLFITSVGLLSLAALQIQGLRCTHSAILRTHAVAYTTEMVEQLHATSATSPDAPPSCTTGPCISTASIEEWQTRILNTLPQGIGTVTIGASSATVQVVWDDHGEAQQFSLSVAL